jgi:hypothetical protein
MRRGDEAVTTRPGHGLSFVTSDAGRVLVNTHNGRADYLHGLIVSSSKCVPDSAPCHAADDRLQALGGNLDSGLHSVSGNEPGNKHSLDGVCLEVNIGHAS